MARIPIAPAPPAPPPDPIWMAVGASDGDPIVYVRDGTGLHRCVAKEERARRIHVNGYSCDHVAEHVDGRWIYEMRSN